MYINIVSDLRHVGGFLQVLRFSPGTPVFSWYSGFLLVLRFSPGTPVSSTNKTDCHDINITEIVLKVA